MTLDVHRSAAIADIPKRKRQPRRYRRRQSPVTTTRVHPDLWRVAMGYAQGNTQRIEVLSAQMVIVHNGSAR